MSAYFSLFFFYLDIPCGQSLSTHQEHLSPHQLVSFQQMWVGQDFCTSFFACDLGFQTLYGIDKVLLSILNVLHCGKNIKTQEFQCHLLKKHWIKCYFHRFCLAQEQTVAAASTYETFSFACLSSSVLQRHLQKKRVF